MPIAQKLMPFLTVGLATFLQGAAPTNHQGITFGPNGERYLGGKRIYDINLNFSGEPRDLNADLHDYQKFKPQPFYYAKDLDTHGGAPFLVGGVNCDDILRNVQNISGVPVEVLSLRARGVPVGADGHVPNAYGSLATRPEWNGANVVRDNFNRGSGEGFIQRDFLWNPKITSIAAEPAAHKAALRNLLLADNAKVRAMGRTHQSLAAPVLDVIAAYQASVLQSDARPGGDAMSVLGDKYSVKMISMGGTNLLSMAKDWKPGFANDIGGWVGTGVQGSFFNDEIFSSKVFEITDNQTGKKLTIDGMTPHLIYRYGFYQGGEYRTEPQTLADFFEPPVNARAWEHCK